MAPLAALWVAWGIWLVAIAALSRVGGHTSEVRPLAGLGATVIAVLAYRLLRGREGEEG